MPKAKAKTKRGPKPRTRFDRFYRYAELTDILKGYAAWRPDLCTVESIGKSHERRDIWLVTLTNEKTGSHGEKPAMWVDGNIHAVEVTGGAAATHLVHRLLTDYGKDPKVTRALDTRTFYVVPRLNPDGVELALADKPKFIRSSTRPWPRTDEQDGLYRTDVDGDGRMLLMRIPDATGNWRPHPDEPRLMVARDPDSGPEDGPYYRLLPEGMIRGNFDGVTVKMAPPLQALDINRNYPADWRPANEQAGAGPYPTSEPEIRAVVQAIIDRPNICGSLNYHTAGGVHLRPFSTGSDDAFPTNDLRTYKAIGKKATEITGCRAISIWHDFRYDLKAKLYGGSVDWPYEHLGIYAWATELWSPMQRAGFKDYHFIEWGRDHPIEDELKLFKWFDETFNGKAFVDWYAFEHPQLGPVEIGGFDSQRYWSNAPPELLLDEIAPHTEFAIYHGLISPLLILHSFEAERTGEQTWRVRLVVANDGWLPTNVSAKAIERRAVRPLEAELTLPRGAKLASGETKTELGQLAGRALKNSALRGGSDPTSDRAKAEWVVHAKAGATIKVEARHQRAGVVRAEVTLE
jgi:murein tripeptide amidase MpaA